MIFGRTFHCKMQSDKNVFGERPPSSSQVTLGYRIMLESWQSSSFDWKATLNEFSMTPDVFDTYIQAYLFTILPGIKLKCIPLVLVLFVRSPSYSIATHR